MDFYIFAQCKATIRLELQNDLAGHPEKVYIYQKIATMVAIGIALKL